MIESVDCVDGIGFGGGFAFIVVLFILLIIVGASFFGGYGGGYAPVAPATDMVVDVPQLPRPTDMVPQLLHPMVISVKNFYKKIGLILGRFF